MQHAVDGPCQLDSNIPSEGLEHFRLFECLVEQSVEELAAAGAVEVGLIRHFALMSRAQGIHGNVSQVFGIVVFAGSESIQPTGEAIYGRVEVEVVIVGEDDLEATVENGGCDLVKMLGDEGDADEICLRALGSC